MASGIACLGTEAALGAEGGERASALKKGVDEAFVRAEIAFEDRRGGRVAGGKEQPTVAGMNGDVPSVLPGKFMDAFLEFALFSTAAGNVLGGGDDIKPPLCDAILNGFCNGSALWTAGAHRRHR